MVVVTDSAAAGEAHFVLSPHAYGSMAYPSKTAELYSLGVVDVDYQRTPCRFPGYNLIFKVVEHSRFPHYLAIVPMFYGGEQDIHGVELQQEGGEKWVTMNKAWGAVWDLAVPPTGALKLRVKVRNANGEEKLIEANKGLPSSWKPGAGYDSHVQLY
ncbi:Expansin-like B1 [Linum grandiflorum]